MTDKPQHCDHECVCNWWACNVNCDILNDPCRRKNCEHDTRSRPLSDEKPCDHCDFNERDAQMADAIMKAKKAERERVLDKYLELLVSCRFELDGEIVVKMGAIRNVREELRGEP